jgi:hypothetical protein
MSPRRPPAVEAAAPERVREAADLFEARQNGSQEPEGAWADRVWLPSDGERRACCAGLEPDRLKDPQKLRSHCRTVLHVATLFELDGRLLRAELKRRRAAREEARGREASAVAREPRRARPAPLAQGAPGEEAGSAEAAVLHARLVRLIAEKRADLRDLAGRASEVCGELQQQLDDDRAAVEVALAETGAGDVAQDLKALIDDITHLVITRDTIRRVL